MQPTKGLFRLAVALLGTVLLVVGCSPPDDGDGNGSGDGNGDGGAAEESGPIRIGLLRPSTGDLAASGLDMEKGWDLYWETNGAEIAGREVETVAEDTAGDPSVALNKINQITRDEGVDLVVGPLLANVGQAVADALGRDEVPLVMPIASADDLTQRTPQEYTVRLAGWTSSQTTHPYGEYVYEQGYERVLTICTDYAFGHENCGGFTNTFTDAGGEVVEQLWNPLGTPDFGSYIASIQEADPDAVFATQVGADSVRFIQAWSEFGLKDSIPLFGNETLLDQSLLRQMEGEAPVGIVSVGHYAEGRDAAGTQDFVDAYLEAEGEMPSYYAAALNTAAGAIVQAIESLDGDLSDPDAVMEALRAVELGDDNPFGPLRVDEYGQSVFDVYVRQVEEGPNGLWNVPIDQYDEVTQFWTYDPDEFLEHPVYSREYQGDGAWPEPTE